MLCNCLKNKSIFYLNLNKPMPHVFITIAGPSYLGNQQPDCNIGLQLVGACPKLSFLLRYVIESLSFI